MSSLTLSGGTQTEESKYLKLKQNKDTIHLIKFIINPASELDLDADNYITIWKDDNKKPVGTAYISKKGTLLYIKDFVASEDNLFPDICDRHLKLLIHLLSQDLDITTFSAAKFTRECNLSKSSITSKRHYNLLDDLSKYLIAHSSNDPDKLITDANKKNYAVHKKEVTFKPVISLKSLTYNMSEVKTNKTEGLIISEAEVTTKLTKAEIEFCKIFTDENRGLMYYHKDLLKVKQNSRTKLGSVSIAFNLYYLESVNNKKKQGKKATYNVSTVLAWVGIYKIKYEHFLKSSKKRGVSYFVNQLNTYFKELECLGIKAEFINMNNDINQFYNKTQIVFDMTDLKNNFK